jgi:putative hydrolase of the HAD superfamily
VWAETPFAGALDELVFSCDVGISKPDPRIYEIACERLGVEPDECLFVGDGANDELPGAERAGMAALQLRSPGEPLTPEGEAWTGRSIQHLSEVLNLT